MGQHVPIAEVPRELNKAVLPEYVVEPPDILTIDAINVVPKSPYRLRTLDVVGVNVLGVLPDIPINGVFPINVGGLVDLGPEYGAVKLSGLTVEEAVTVLESLEPYTP